MKITQHDDFSNLKTPEEVTVYVTQFCQNVKDIVNGNLEFGENMKVSIIDVTFDSANTDVRSSHSLGKVPIGYIVAKSSAAVNVYDGSAANTDSLIYLRASGSATIKVIIF